MNEDIILLSEYCAHSCAEPDFIRQLADEGLIATEMHEDLPCIPASQLHDLDLFTRLHYDLSINIEGIDVIHNLLRRMRLMEQELSVLRRQLGAEPFCAEDFFEEW